MACQSAQTHEPPELINSVFTGSAGREIEMGTWAFHLSCFQNSWGMGCCWGFCRRDGHFCCLETIEVHVFLPGLWQYVGSSLKCRVSDCFNTVGRTTYLWMIHRLRFRCQAPQPPDPAQWEARRYLHIRPSRATCDRHRSIFRLE